MQHRHSSTNLFRYTPSYTDTSAVNYFYRAAEGGRQTVSVCCSRLLSPQLQLQTSDATPGHIAFQMSPHHMSVCVSKRKRQHEGDCVCESKRKRERQRSFLTNEDQKKKKTLQHQKPSVPFKGSKVLINSIDDVHKALSESKLISCQG